MRSPALTAMVFCALALFGGCAASVPTPTPSPSPTPVPTATATATPHPTPTPLPTPTRAPTPTPHVSVDEVNEFVRALTEIARGREALVKAYTDWLDTGGYQQAEALGKLRALRVQARGLLEKVRGVPRTRNTRAVYEKYVAALERNVDFFNFAIEYGSTPSVALQQALTATRVDANRLWREAGDATVDLIAELRNVR